MEGVVEGWRVWRGEGYRGRVEGTEEGWIGEVEGTEEGGSNSARSKKDSQHKYTHALHILPQEYLIQGRQPTQIHTHVQYIHSAHYSNSDRFKEDSQRTLTVFSHSNPVPIRLAYQIWRHIQPVSSVAGYLGNSLIRGPSAVNHICIPHSQQASTVNGWRGEE